MRKLLLACVLGAVLAPVGVWGHDDDDDRRRRRDRRDRRDGRVWDDDDYYRGRDRDRVWRNGPYGNRGSYGNRGYGRSASPVQRTIRDLQSVGSTGYLDSHNRNHVREALDKLYEFQDRWAQGRWDESKLDRAIDNMKHLVEADEINRSDRNRLARDIEDLRAFRASRGGEYGYRNEPVFGRWPR